MDQKMTGAKKVKMLKNQFFHACQPRNEIFEICSYCELIFLTVFWNFEFLFQDGGRFFEKNFWLKLLHMVGTLVGLTSSLIKKSWMTSTVYVMCFQRKMFFGWIGR